MPQTVPIRRNADFLALDGYIDGLLSQKGYKRLERKGSTSWIDPRIQPADAAVKFKLAFFGPTRITFGVREEFVTDTGLTAAHINCPDTFTVRPSPVPFVGFTVANDAADRQRIANVLANFP
jgi:hypothetical protein